MVNKTAYITEDAAKDLEKLSVALGISEGKLLQIALMEFIKRAEEQSELVSNGKCEGKMGS